MGVSSVIYSVVGNSSVIYSVMWVSSIIYSLVWVLFRAINWELDPKKVIKLTFAAKGVGGGAVSGNLARVGSHLFGPAAAPQDEPYIFILFFYF